MPPRTRKRKTGGDGTYSYFTIYGNAGKRKESKEGQKSAGFEAEPIRLGIDEQTQSSNGNTFLDFEQILSSTNLLDHRH